MISGNIFILGIKLIQDLSEYKAKTFMLETKLKDMERRKGRIPEKDDKYLEKSYQTKLVEKEKEIEKMKREMTYVKDSKKDSKKQNTSKDDISFTSDKDNSSQQDLALQSENQFLKDHKPRDGFESENNKLLEKKIRQQQIELEFLCKDVDSKAKKIKDLSKLIDESKNPKTENASADELSNVIDKTREEELLRKLEQQDLELNKWKLKVDELQRINSVLSDDDKFQKLYLNQITPPGSALPPSEGYLELLTPQSNDGMPQGGMLSSLGVNPVVASAATSDSGYPSQQNIHDSYLSPIDGKDNLIDLNEPLYQELISEFPGPDNRPSIKPKNATVADSHKRPASKIPISPTKRLQLAPGRVTKENKLMSPSGTVSKENKLMSPSGTVSKENKLMSSSGTVSKENKLASSSGTVSKEVGKIFYDQQEDIQELLSSVEMYQDQNTQLKEELKEKISEDQEKQVNFQTFVKLLQDELDIYRSNIGATEHDNLTELGYEQLNNLIDYNICTRNLTDIQHLQSDIAESNKENELLTEEMNKLKYDLKVNNTDGSELLALKEKCNLKMDENKTLKELLETQTQNVTSQGAVIRTLKNDLANNKVKFKNDYEGVVQDLKEKKTEGKNLKKQIKENSKMLQKERIDRKNDIRALKSKLKNENKGNIEREDVIQGLKDEINSLKKIRDVDDDNKERDIELLTTKLENEKEKYESLEQKLFIREEEHERNIQEREEENKRLLEKLKSTETDYENVLKHAESALEDAKHKLNDQDKKSDELKKQLQNMTNERNKGKEMFKDVTEDMKYALAEKNTVLNKIKNEFDGYKEVTSEELKLLNKQVTDLEKQCRDYKVLLERTYSTTSELEFAKTELESLRSELSSLECLKKDSLNTKQGNDTLLSTADLTSEENTLTKPFFSETDQTDNMELEIEYEIIKGCNEELENENESLKMKIIYYEDVLENEEIELKQTKTDLEKSLGYLRELAEKNDELTEQKIDIEERLVNEENKNEDFLQQLEMFEKKEKHDKDTEIVALESALFQSTSVNEQNNKRIEQMEDVIDDLEKDLLAEHSFANENKKRYEEERIEFGSIIKELEKEIQSNEVEMGKIQLNYKQEKDGYMLKLEIKDDENEKLVQKRIELENTNKELEESIEEWIRKYRERTKELEESNQEWVRKYRDRTDELNKLNDELVFCQTQTIKLKPIEEGKIISKETDILKLDIQNKNIHIKNLQYELDDKQVQYDKLLNSLNKRRIESKTFLKMQDQLHNEIDRKEDVIRKLKFKLKSNELDVTDTSFDFSVSEVTDIEFIKDEGNEDWLVDDKESLINDQREGLNFMADQLSNMRKRHNVLRKELEDCREKYINTECEKFRSDGNVKILTNELEEVKGKLGELRMLMQKSPNESFSDENKTVGFKTKLYAAYKELREKSVEIATLLMSLEVKDVEISTLSKQLKNSKKDSFVSKSPSPTIFECNHPSDIKTLLRGLSDRDANERQLQDQITELRQNLMTKSEHCDYLQKELTGVVGKLKTVEKELLEEDWSLRERFVYGSEENSDISEFTPVTATSDFPFSSEVSALVEEDTITPMDTNQIDNETFLIDGFNEDKLKETVKIEELESLTLQKDEEILYYRDQINDLRDETSKLKDQRNKFEKETKELNNKALKTEKELFNRKEEIKILQLKLTDLTIRNVDGR